jgi:hypothetical protein
VDEVEDLVTELRAIEGGRIRADRVLANGRGMEFLGKIPAVDFDIDRSMEEWGPGRYRLYGRVDGEAKVRWKRLITVAGKPAAAATAPAHFPTWTPPANPPGWPPGYPPPHYFYQPQPQQQPTNNDTAMASVMNLMLTQSKQQSDLLIAMMNRQVEATGRAPHVNELGELLKLAKELAGLKKGGGGDEDESIMGPAIGSFLGTIAQAWKAEAENNRLNAGDRQRAPASTAKANRAAQTIQRSAQPSNQVPAAAGGGEGSGAPPAPASAPRRAAPSPDPVEVKIRKIASLVVITDEDDQRDPSAFAEVTYSILGPELAAAIVEAAAEGEMAPQLIATYPKLESSREFLGEIEKELRSIVADAAAEVPPPEPAAAGASEDAAAGQGKEETD